MTTPRATVVMPILLEHSWQWAMTVCALDTLVCTTKEPFNIIVVETESKALAEWKPLEPLATVEIGYRHIYIPARSNPTADLNVGLEEVDTEYVIYTGNDIFVRPDWLEALFECFKLPDCGIATLASADLSGAPLAQYFGSNRIMEGLYGPFMMFGRNWRFDGMNFPSQFADSDLMMRIYTAGQRSYRNNRVIIQHLNRQTINGPVHEAGLKEAQHMFINKWKTSPLLIYRILTEGWVV